MTTINTDNYTISGVELFFDTTVGHASLLTGTSFQSTTRSLGNVVTAGLTPDVTYVDHFVTRKGKKVKDKTIANMSLITIDFSFDEMNQDNLNRFLLGSAVGSDIRVLQNTLEEGAAQLLINTDIGQDLVYRIPKCTLKPNGAMDFSDETWHEGPMQLEVLEYQDGDTSNATLNASYLVFPFGKADTSNL